MTVAAVEATGAGSAAGAEAAGSSSAVRGSAGAGKATRSASGGVPGFAPPKLPKFAKKEFNHSGIVIGEWFVAMGFASLGSFRRISSQGYLQVVSGEMLRWSAISGVFFVLLLLSAGKRGSHLASWIGGVIDLAIIYGAVNKGDTAILVNLVTGQPAGVTDTATLTKSLKVNEFYTSEDKPLQESPGTATLA